MHQSRFLVACLIKRILANWSVEHRQYSADVSADAEDPAEMRHLNNQNRR